MTNPTSAFGWQMPTSTDLVTDLPADFEVFGQAVDTSLADLKGGTTGQVLSKASNTDMDFTWVAQDDSNAIQNAIVDAKGDLIAASAADTPARLAVGANGESIVADSSTSTGLRWQGSMAAGKNFVINGNLDIWQRGTSITAGTNGQYTADRWQAGAIYGNSVWSQQTTGVPDGSRYCMRVNSSATGNLMPAQQIIETNNTSQLWGKTVTFSVKVRRNATFGNSLVVSVEKSATVDAAQSSTWTSISSTTIANASLPTGTTSADWITATVTAAIPADGTANSIKVMIAPNTTVALNGYFEYTQAQLELGTVATAFTRAGATIQGELAACQRYFQRYGGASLGGEAYASIGLGYVANAAATQLIIDFPFITSMRIAPSSVSFNNLVGNNTINDYAVSAITLRATQSSNSRAQLNVTIAAATQYRPLSLISNGATGYLDLNGEL